MLVWLVLLLGLFSLGLFNFVVFEFGLLWLVLSDMMFVGVIVVCGLFSLFCDLGFVWGV